MNAYDLEPLIWNMSRDARIARHEAGHAIVYVVQGKLDQIDKVSIAPRGKCGGRVRLYGQPSDEEQDKLGPIRDAKEIWPDLPDAVEGNPEHVRLMAHLGALDYAGCAAEFPSLGDGFFSGEALYSSVYDRESFEAVLATRARLFWSRHAWCGPAFDGAARMVDSAWGETLAITAALMERKTLSGPEVADLIGKASKMTNHRRPAAWWADTTQE